MSEKNPYRFGPTRGELWFWLWISLGGLAFGGVAVLANGIPSGPALVEVIVLTVLLFGFLGGRSIKRLIRREHP